MSKPEMEYPSVDEPDGNVFVVLGMAKRALKRAGLEAEAKEMTDRVTSSGSYDEAIAIMEEYVEPL